MPLHQASDPVTKAEAFAQHLEDDYGVGLDQYRRAVLIGEIEALLEPSNQQVTYPCGCSATASAGSDPLPNYCPEHGVEPPNEKDSKALSPDDIRQAVALMSPTAADRAADVSFITGPPAAEKEPNAEGR